VSEANLRIGKFKNPIGLEMLQGIQNLSFMERSLVRNLIPNRDLGAMLSGQVLRGRLEYQLRVFNGAPSANFAEEGKAFSTGKSLTFRWFSEPFLYHGPEWIQGFGVGFRVRNVYAVGGDSVFRDNPDACLRRVGLCRRPLYRVCSRCGCSFAVLEDPRPPTVENLDRQLEDLKRRLDAIQSTPEPAPTTQSLEAIAPPTLQELKRRMNVLESLALGTSHTRGLIERGPGWSSKSGFFLQSNDGNFFSRSVVMYRPTIPVVSALHAVVLEPFWNDVGLCANNRKRKKPFDRRVGCSAL
jgi:hypothetical protein